MPVSSEFTKPIEDPKPQRHTSSSEGQNVLLDTKVSKVGEVPSVLTLPTGQKIEAIHVDISQPQPASPPEAKPGQEAGSRIEKATKEAIEALVEGFERGSSLYPSLLQKFLAIPCQALQNLKKVNPELHSKMAHAVLTMIRTGDQAEILALFDNDKNLVQSLAKLNPDVNQAIEYTNPPLCWAVWRNTSKADKLIRILVGLGADVNIKGQRGETALYNAVRAGRTETVKLLVSLGADVNIPAAHGTTPLREAFLYQKYDMIQTLLSFHASYTLADLTNPKKYETPLYNAVASGDEEKVKLLVSMGASVNQPGAYPPLWRALFTNSLSMIKFLIEHGAQVKPEDVNYPFEKQTPLYNAVASGDEEKMKLLVSMGADVNQPSGAYDKPPLWKAVFTGSLSMIKFLIDHGAQVNLEDVNFPWGDETPLYCAVLSCDEEKMKLLVSMGADVNQPSGAYDKPPLWKAVFTGSLSMIKFLIDHGAQVNLEDVNFPWGDETPLYCAVHSCDEERVKLLVSMGANINQPSGAYDKPPLWIALFIGSLSMIKFLIDHGAQVNLEDVNFPWGDETPLYYAVRSCDEERVKFLVSMGANVNQPSGAYDKPPLWRALFTDSLSMIKLLIDQGAQMNSEYVDYPWGKCTPLIWSLYYASSHERLELVKVLTSLGADCNLLDEEGCSPLTTVDALPSSEGKPISQWLIEHGADKEWHESFSALKGIAHSWALKGEGKIYNVATHTFQIIKLTGWFNLCSLKLIRKIFQDFVEEQMKPQGSEYQTIGKTILKILDHSVDHGCSTEVCKELARLSEKEPVFLAGGTSTHSIGYVVHQNRIYTCNRGRGAGKSPGVKEYEFNRKLETELLFFIQKAISCKEPWDGLKATFDALQPCLKRLFRQSWQKVGNCSWSSYESGLHVLLLIIMETQIPRIRYPLFDGLPINKAFTNFSRKKTLFAYLQIPEPDPSVLQQIEGKLRQEDEDLHFSSEEKEELLKKIKEKIHTSK